MDTFWFFENISESTRKISMRLRLFSVDVFWLTACHIVVLSTGSPLHPELPKPCIDQPPATLVKFGSSKVKMPFLFFFRLKHLLWVPTAWFPRGEFRRTCWFPSAPVACSMSQSKSAELETGLLISTVVPTALISVWEDGEAMAAVQKPLAHPGALVPALLLGAAPGRAVHSGGNASGWPLWQVLPKSYKK